jgi:uncharacterized protein
MAAPQIRSLTRQEMYDLLARNHVGRIAYSWRNHVDIEPVHYVYDGGWLYGRTSRGMKTEVAGGGWAPVAFEVDEVSDVFDWESVVVHGGFYWLAAEGSEFERRTREKAIEIFRRLIPQSFTPEDPTPYRDVMFMIAVQEISGRAASGEGENRE